MFQIFFNAIFVISGFIFKMKFNFFRWLTTSERICGLYIRDQNPSVALQTMMTFTAQSYAPAHFDIFLDPGFENTAHHYLNYIKRSKVKFSCSCFLAFSCNKNERKTNAYSKSKFLNILIVTTRLGIMDHF